MKLRVGNVLFIMLAIVTVISVAFVGFNLLSGAKGYAVTSDSMKDTINMGDIVFVKPVSFEELEVGDIITVTSTGEKFNFTHRIVGIDRQARTVTTRGDANLSDDPMPTEAERIVGKVWYSVPLLGYITILFSGDLRTSTIIILTFSAVGTVIINTLLTKYDSKRKRGDSDE